MIYTGKGVILGLKIKIKMIKLNFADEKIPHEKIYHYDVIILGGGPAGLTAAIYASRYGMKTVLISKEIGGMANYAVEVENYPGYKGSGKRLMKKFFLQARKSGAEIIQDDIINIEKDGNGMIVAVSGKKIIHAKSIIIALGTQRKKLNIQGEDKFLGRGVSYCATCDGSFFKNKDVAVIGGADAACKSVLLLSGIAKRVYLVCRGEKVNCEPAIAKKIGMKKNVLFFNNSSPMEIRGKNKVKELVIWKKNKELGLKVDGVFVEAGGLPLSDIAKLLGLKLDEQGYIHVDSEMKTNVHGIFAAGDVVKSKLKQIVIAASQGAVAAKSAHEFIQNL